MPVPTHRKEHYSSWGYFCVREVLKQKGNLSVSFEIQLVKGFASYEKIFHFLVSHQSHIHILVPGIWDSSKEVWQAKKLPMFSWLH